jgi:hypothetical protein
VWYTGEQVSQPDILSSVATKLEKVYPIMQCTKFPVAFFAVYHAYFWLIFPFVALNKM